MKFLFIGSAFLGVDKAVAGPLSVYARHYNLQVVHLGPLATEDEVKMWRFREQKVRTWEHAVAQFAGSSDFSEAEIEEAVEAAFMWMAERGIRTTEVVSWGDFLEDEPSGSDLKYLKLKLQMRINLSRVKAEMDVLLGAQSKRIATLHELFPNIGFVFSDNCAIEGEALKSRLGSRFLGTKFQAGKIDAISMLANGPKASHAPITARTVAALAGTGRSTVMPHPISMSDSRAKEGLNNARNYFTTGCLVQPEAPTSTRDIHKGKHMPGGVVCVVDEDEAFFANNLIVDKGSNYFIAEDGLIFTAGGVVELGGAKCAVTLTDSHVPYQHWGVTLAACRAARAMGAKTFIHNGDLDEGDGVNRHAMGLPGQMEGKRIIDSLRAVKEFLRVVEDESGCEEFVWNLGNHEMWYTQLVDKYPNLKGMLDWKTLASDYYPRWNIVQRTAGENKIYRFGDLAFRHGDEESLQAAVEAFQKVINGHWHNYYRIGQSGKLGCSCRLGPAYVGNNITAWQSQFATHTIGQGGKTQTAYRTVIHDEELYTSRFVYRNEIHTVNWRAYV